MYKKDYKTGIFIYFILETVYIKENNHLFKHEIKKQL